MKNGSLHNYVTPARTAAFKVPYLREAEQVVLSKIYTSHDSRPFELVTFISNHTKTEDAKKWDSVSAGSIRVITDGFKLRGLLTEEKEVKVISVGYYRTRCKLTPRALQVMEHLEEYVGLPVRQRRVAIDVLLCLHLCGKKKYKAQSIVKDLSPHYPIASIDATIEMLNNHFGFIEEAKGVQPVFRLTPEGQSIVDAIMSVSELF